MLIVMLVPIVAPIAVVMVVVIPLVVVAPVSLTVMVRLPATIVVSLDEMLVGPVAGLVTVT